MATVFYYEDQDAWRTDYEAVMSSNGYKVKAFSNNLEAERFARTPSEWQPDVAVLDIKDQLTQTNVGFRLCEEVRRRWPGLPVVFLTSYEHGSAEELRALRAGANYFLNKVKDTKGLFLLAALENLLATGGGTDPEGVYSRGPLRVNKNEHLAYWHDQRIKLTDTEFLILDFLAFLAGTRQSYERIRRAAQIQEVRDEDIDFRDEEEKARVKEARLRNNLQAHIRAIREKLEAAHRASGVQSTSGIPFRPRDVLMTENDFGYRWQSSR